MFKFGLIGHGYIGKAIANRLELHNQRTSLNPGASTITVWVNHNQIKELENVDVIINAGGFTGYPNVDACENNKEATIDGNNLFPLMLHAMYPKKKIVHISSGCIYNNLNNLQTFSEEDEPNFTFVNGSFYSGCKAMAEKLLKPKLEESRSSILRIRIPFDVNPHLKNIITKFELYSDILMAYNSMSRLSDVVEVAVQFAYNQIDNFGVYNVVNTGAIAHWDIVRLLGLDYVKNPISQEQLNKLINTPRSTCILNNDKLKAVYDIDSADSAMEKTVAQYLRNK